MILNKFAAKTINGHQHINHPTTTQAFIRLFFYFLVHVKKFYSESKEFERLGSIVITKKLR